MPAESFRFLHASNFQLDQPLRGLIEVPEPWHDSFVNAPYSSAERVFQAAVREEVDFVILSGDIVDTSEAGPRALAFLHEQFELLRRHDITIYWAASQSDISANWLSESNFPSNVQIFPSTSVEEISHFRGDRAIATLLGRSWSGQTTIRAGDFRHDRTADFHIVAACGGADMEELQRDGINFWALGGLTQPRTINSGAGVIHYSGAPQGFSPQDSGPRGCTLVSVDSAGEVRLRMIETDSIRWIEERVRIRDGAGRDEIRTAMQNQLRSRLGSTGGRPLLVSWWLAGVRRFAGPKFSGLEEELLVWLRGEFGNAKPPAWSVSIDLEAPESLPSDWADEDSLLGDFLRTLKGFQEDPERPFTLDSYLPDRQAIDKWGDMLKLADSPTRARVLQEAAMLGVELLRGDDARSLDLALGTARYGKERIST